MGRFAGLLPPQLLVATWLVAATSTPATATTIGFPSTGPTTPTFEVPPGPASPNLRGLTPYMFDLAKLYPLAFPGLPVPNPLPTGLFAENTTSFHLALLAGFGRTGFIDPVVADQTFTFLITGSFWSVQARVEYDAASFPLFDADVVSLKGDVVHRIAPHPGEFRPGDAVLYDILLHGARAVTVPPRFASQISNEALLAELRAKNFQPPADARFGFDFNAEIHPGGSHHDVVVGLLVGRVTRAVPGITRDDFEWWLGGVSGLHVVPEPSSLILLGSALAGVTALGRKKLFRGHDRQVRGKGAGTSSPV